MPQNSPKREAVLTPRLIAQAAAAQRLGDLSNSHQAIGSGRGLDLDTGHPGLWAPQSHGTWRRPAEDLCAHQALPQGPALCVL